MKGNDSREQVVSSIVRYTGLAALGIAAINPSKEELVKLLNLTEEPKETMYQYTGFKTKDDNGNERESNKVRIWLRGENTVLTDKTDAAGNKIPAKEVITVAYDVFVSDRDHVSSKGTPLTLNALGNSTYQSIEALNANENMKWFTKHGPLKQAKEGEAELIEFFRNFLNLKNSDEAGFADYSAIARGEVGELRKYASQWKDNKVIMLLGAKVDGDKVYQALYTKLVLRPTIKNCTELFMQNLNKPYKDFKAEYHPSLKLQYYIPTAETPDAPSTASAPATGGGLWT